IEWTFDPMQALNAHLNFSKLGVVVEEYEENVYGESTSPLHKGNPTDRFIAEWWIREPSPQSDWSGAPVSSQGSQVAVVRKDGRVASRDRERARARDDSPMLKGIGRARVEEQAAHERSRSQSAGRTQGGACPRKRDRAADDTPEYRARRRAESQANADLRRPL